MTQPDPAIRPFSAHTAEAELNDLHVRLHGTRLPEAETVCNGRGPQRWSQGVPLRDLADVIEHWLNFYDWRAFESRINSIGQFLTTVDELDIHFLHQRSPRADAVPLILTHGWPGSIAEFVNIVDELTSPSRESDPAFHVVVPSLPGFGYSGKPKTTGWNVERIALAWVELMERLGYPRFLAHGGDWGGIVTTVLGGRFPGNVIGIHTTVAQPPPGLSSEGLNPFERKWADQSSDFWNRKASYAKLQAEQPQTIGTALVDSPAGQLAWIMDKFFRWTDTQDSPFETISIDRMLDDVTLYWLTRSGASSARIYAESHDSLDPTLVVDVPSAVCTYPEDIEKWPRPWVSQRFRNLVHWRVAPAGGHFPTLECPDYFLGDLRSGLQAIMRSS